MAWLLQKQSCLHLPAFILLQALQETQLLLWACACILPWVIPSTVSVPAPMCRISWEVPAEVGQSVLWQFFQPQSNREEYPGPST